MPSEVADLREDIATAMSRMRGVGRPREIERLTKHLVPGEQVLDMTRGYYGTVGWWSWTNSGWGMIVLTNRRILFLRHHWMGHTLVDVSLRQVHGAGFTRGVGSGAMKVLRSAYTAETFHSVDNEDGERIVHEVRTLVAALKRGAAQP